MKTIFALLATLLLPLSPGHAQKPAVTVPEELKPQFDILNKAYPSVEAKRHPKAPADSVWMFRSGTTAAGTVEVGFQKGEVVYMVFRKGTGGASWKAKEIFDIHMMYHRELLKETYSPSTGFSKYHDSVMQQINAAVITRKDFDPKALGSAL